jgi:hypothetical protein
MSEKFEIIALDAQAQAAEPENLVLSAVETEAEEMARFRAMIVAAFAPVKIARESLSYPRNVSKAQIFANALTKLFTEELS